MNVKLIVVGLLLIINLTNMGAQNLSGYIKYDYYIDTVASTKKLTKYKEDQPEKFAKLGKQLKMVDQFADNLSFNLHVTDNVSFFSLEDQVLPDDLMEQMAYKTAVILALEAKEAYWIDHEQESRSFFTNWMGSKIQVTQPFHSLQWEITGQRKFLRGKTLLEATTTVQLSTNKEGEKTTVRAWYDPELPLPFGPAGYHGLPGLILELFIEAEITKGFSASVIELKNDPDPKQLEMPKVMATMTELEYASRVFGTKQ